MPYKSKRGSKDTVIYHFTPFLFFPWPDPLDNIFCLHSVLKEDYCKVKKAPASPKTFKKIELSGLNCS
jgi:hypothetical protein